MLELGIKAADFELPDQNGEMHKLSGTFCAIYDFSVKKTAAGLIFWPFSCKLKDNHCLLYTSPRAAHPHDHHQGLCGRHSGRHHPARDAEHDTF